MKNLAINILIDNILNHFQHIWMMVDVSFLILKVFIVNYMNNIIKIYKQKIPSSKVALFRGLMHVSLAIPRKTNFSGHFHLKHPIISENLW